MDRLRGKRLQCRQGSRWVTNTPERAFGLHIAVCPSCGTFNPHDVGTDAPARCHKCNAPMLSACPSHGEASCSVNCQARPCRQCGGLDKVPPLIDPVAFRKGKICTACGREIIGKD